jgi:hypothetical protein
LKGENLMIDAEDPVIEFTAEDRCDRCGAQAYMLAQHEDFGELMFCAHHRREHVQTLFDEGWKIVDDYEGLERLAPNLYHSPV